MSEVFSLRPHLSSVNSLFVHERTYRILPNIRWFSNATNKCWILNFFQNIIVLFVTSLVDKSRKWNLTQHWHLKGRAQLWLNHATNSWTEELGGCARQNSSIRSKPILNKKYEFTIILFIVPTERPHSAFNLYDSRSPWCVYLEAWILRFEPLLISTCYRSVIDIEEFVWTDKHTDYEVIL